MPLELCLVGCLNPKPRSRYQRWMAWWLYQHSKQLRGNAVNRGKIRVWERVKKIPTKPEISFYTWSKIWRFYSGHIGLMKQKKVYSQKSHVMLFAVFVHGRWASPVASQLASSRWSVYRECDHVEEVQQISTDYWPVRTGYGVPA